MSVESVRDYLERFGKAGDVLEFPVSSATVALAAVAIRQQDPTRFADVQPAHIAKTMSFLLKDGSVVLVVTAGDTAVDNKKFKAVFGCKAKMLTAEEVPLRTGHPVGGVCPFALPEGVTVVTDLSLLRFPTVFPACGSANSAIPLTPDELFVISGAMTWADVCSIREVSQNAE